LVSGLELLTKSGAIVSAAGVALLVTFVAVLLVFQVAKTCEGGGGKCKYESSAPAQLQPIFSQGFFALSLIVIAAGILMIRYSRWRESKAAAQG
jgi:Zn-dependent protease with chaperone function